MTPFRLGHDELQHELPWLLMRNGPVTKYCNRSLFDRDLSHIEHLGYHVRRFDCSLGSSETDLHASLKSGLALPAYTGAGFDALADSLTEIDVPVNAGVVVALDNFTESHRADILLEVLAAASWRWLLFGRFFCAVLRTDDATYEGAVVGGSRPLWNGEEWLAANRRS